MAGGAPVRAVSWLPEPMRAPAAMIGVFGVLAGTLGLYALSTHRDRIVADATAETEELAELLLERAEELQGEGGVGVLAQALLTNASARSAAVVLGDAAVLEVGSDAPSGADPDEVAATAEPLVQQVDDSVVVWTAFARVSGAPVVLGTRTALTPLGLGWAGIMMAWGIVALGIAGTSALLERGRRDRVLTLEETVQALYAHDVEVTRQQQDLLRTKTDFVSAISQELRTPLQVIKGVANRLATGDRLSSEERDNLVDGLRLHADRLDLLLGDLIDVDRLTQRTVGVNRRDVLVRDAVAAALEGLDTQDHDLRIDVGDVVAKVTPGHLERIVRCLVHNAIKYAPPGSVVRVGAVRDDATVVVSVDDEGPGIAVNDRSTVFEPLRQLADDPGMGLGLALVKRYAELHGGRAWVEESEGGGAGFRVAIPDKGDAVRMDPWRVADAHAGSDTVPVVSR